MRQGFTIYANGWQASAKQYIGSDKAIGVLQEIYSSAPTFYLGNSLLAERLKCSTRTVRRAVAHLAALGLISHDVTRSYSGARRTMCLTPACKTWMREGTLPEQLVKVSLHEQTPNTNPVTKAITEEKPVRNPLQIIHNADMDVPIDDELKQVGLREEEPAKIFHNADMDVPYKKNKKLKKENYTRMGVHNFSFTSPAGLLAKHNSFNAKTARDLWGLSTMRLDMGRVVDSSTGAAVSLYQDHDVFDAEFRRVFAAHLPDYLHTVTLHYSFQANGMKFAGQ